MTLSQRVRLVLKEEGMRGLWSRIVWEAGGIVYRRMLLLGRSFDEPFPQLTARLPVAFDLLKETEIADYISLLPDTNVSEIRSRLHRGHLCVMGRHAGQIVSVFWASTSSGKIGELTREIKLAPDEVFYYGAFTSPHFRRSGLIQAMLLWSMPQFRDRGFKRGIVHVRPDNIASIRALEKVGFRSFAVIGYVKLGHWRREFFKLL